MSRNEQPAMWAYRALTSAFFVLFILIAIASFLPGQRLWGISHLAFYPLPVRLAALALIALGFVPRFARLVYAAFSSALRPLLARSKRGWILAIGAAVVMTAALSLVRIETHLLSEGRFLAALISQGATTTAETTVSVRNVIEQERLAPGTMVLYLLASKASLALSDRGMAGGILILNLLLFALLVLILFRFAAEMRMKIPIAAIFLTLAIFSGATVLFAGYLTKYAPFFVFAAVYIVSGFRYLHGRCTIAAPVLACLLAFTMHIFGMLLLPSLIYLIVHRVRRERVTVQNTHIMRALVIVTAGLALAGAINPKFRIFYLPIVGTSEADGILSPGHIADLFNILLLAIPALPLLLSVPTINRTLAGTSRTRTSGESPPDDARMHAALESHYAILLLVPWLCVLLLFKPQIAFAREWDRYILCSLGLMPVMFVGWKQLVRHALAGAGQQGNAPRFTDSLASAIAPALIITLVMTAAWSGINSSARRSEVRFEKLLGFEKISAADGYEQLSFYYSNQGKMLKSSDAAEQAYTLNPTPMNGLNLAMVHLAMEDTLRALDTLTETLGASPEADIIRHRLITLLDQTGEYRRMVQVCLGGIERTPDEPQYYYFLGKGYLYLGRLGEGVVALKKCADLNPPQPVLDNIDSLMSRLRKKQ